jgi:hypothetical protein
MHAYICQSPSCCAYQGKILTAYNLRVSPETASPSFSELEDFFCIVLAKKLLERTILSIRDEKEYLRVRNICNLFRLCPFSSREGAFYMLNQAIEPGKGYVMNKQLNPLNVSDKGNKPDSLVP